MTLVLLILLGVFAALTLARIGFARRAQLQPYWPAFLAGLIALVLALRGLPGPALAAGAVAALLAAARLGGRLNRRAAAAQAGMSEADARAILGVGRDADARAIREAYRRRMREAHPDRGGSHERAARLNAAKDLLLRGRPAR